jgi:hypothetical protein
VYAQALVIRSALACPKLALLRPRLHAFVSLASPHLGYALTQYDRGPRGEGCSSDGVGVGVMGIMMMLMEMGGF